MDVKVITKPIFVAVLTLAGPCAFASAITYDFTGKVLFGQGSFISSNGSTVSGTFTIDFDAAVPTESFAVLPRARHGNSKPVAEPNKTPRHRPALCIRKASR